MTGSLVGVRVLEVAGIGPGPVCAMLHADALLEGFSATQAELDRPPAAPGQHRGPDRLGLLPAGTVAGGTDGQ